MYKILFILITASMVYATTHTFSKPVNTDRLHKELVAGGCSVSHINSRGIAWEVISESGGFGCDPQPIIDAHVYVNPATKLATLNSDIAALAVKHRADTITVQESKDLTDKMLQHMGF